MTPKEFDILYFLARNRVEVFTKEQIYQVVWEEDFLLADSNIMAFIRKIRKRLNPILMLRSILLPFGELAINSEMMCEINKLTCKPI